MMRVAGEEVQTQANTITILKTMSTLKTSSIAAKEMSLVSKVETKTEQKGERIFIHFPGGPKTHERSLPPHP